MKPLNFGVRKVSKAHSMQLVIVFILICSWRVNAQTDTRLLNPNHDLSTQETPAEKWQRECASGQNRDCVSSGMINPNHEVFVEETETQKWLRECSSGQKLECIGAHDSGGGGRKTDDDENKVPEFRDPPERQVDTKRVGKPTGSTDDIGSDPLPDIPGTGAFD